MLSVMPEVVKTLHVSSFTLITIWFDVIFISQLRKLNPERLRVLITWLGCFEFILRAALSWVLLWQAPRRRRAAESLQPAAVREPARSGGAPGDRAGRWPGAAGPRSTPSPGLVFMPVCMGRAKSLRRVRLFAALWTVALQAPPSMGFSRQEYWSGLPCCLSGDLPDPGTELASLKSPDLAGWFFTTNTTWEAQCLPYLWCKIKKGQFFFSPSSV